MRTYSKSKIIDFGIHRCKIEKTSATICKMKSIEFDFVKYELFQNFWKILKFKFIYLFFNFLILQSFWIFVLLFLIIK